MQKVGNQGNFGSSMNQRFANRVSGAGIEASAALISMSGMHNPNTGLFSMQGAGGAGGKSITAGIMTPEGVKRYNAAMAGLAPEIAAAQNQGMAPRDAQIQAIEQAVSIGPTDDLTTKQYKIATAARYVRNGITAAMDIASQQQQKTMKATLKRLAVFPSPDKIAGSDWSKGVFSQPGNPNLKPGETPAPAPEGQPGTTQTKPQIASPKTQEDFNALPSGTVYIDPQDGKQYRKP